MTQAAKKCLIVEDVPDWMDKFEKVAVKNEFEIKKAVTLSDAKLAIEREFFHVALVDLSLTKKGSDTTGLEVLNWLHLLKEGTQSVLITAHGTLEAGFQAGAEFGASAAISKAAFDADKLSDILKERVKIACEAQKELARKLSDSAAELFHGDQRSHLWDLEVISALNPSQGIRHVGVLLDALVSPLQVLMPPKAGNPSVIDQVQGLVHSRFWSRAIGKPVKITFGKVASVEALLAQLSPDEIVLKHQRLNLSGFVEVDHTTPLETFKSPFEGSTGKAAHRM